MTASWHLGGLLAYDCESTGISPEQDRIVTATVALLDGSGHTPPETLDTLIAPEIDISQGAYQVHGISNEHAREHGVPPVEGVEFIAGVLATALTALMPDAPLIGHNVVYDLTMLDRELRRYDLQPLTDRLGDRPLYCVDTLVLSKYLNPYRKRVSDAQGAHQLKTCAQIYGVGWDDAAAHDASYDALTSARVAWMIGYLSGLDALDLQAIEVTLGDIRVRPWRDSRDVARLRRLHGMPLAKLHELQVRVKAEQADSYRAYLKGQGKHDGDVSGDWPLIPAQAQGALV
ncbi:MAG TPA: exonuclease domain-containing protein [Streptosporangiaceae bacterium]|jgi:DNA polymerase-3 subunit epsilon|nr:exonuclease domain-containing protein [Streptosporangiaceae bacterium]